MSFPSQRDSTSDVFYPDSGPKPSTPSKPTVQGLEHILHSRGVRKPSQGGGPRPPSEGRGRTPSHHADYDSRDRPSSRQSSNYGPPRDNGPPPYNGAPRPRENEPPRYKDKEPSRPQGRDYEPHSRPQGRDYEPPSRPQGRDYEPPSRPQGRDYEPPSRPQGRDYEPPSRPQGRDYEPLSRPQGRDYEPPSRPQGRDYEPPSRPQGRDYEPASRPQGRDYEPPRYGREGERYGRDPPRYEQQATDNRREKTHSERRQQGQRGPQDMDLGVRANKSTDQLTPQEKHIESSKVNELEEDDKPPERESWGHKAEFILATIGLAVGLGNVWRFPYLCQKNGGGAFLIPYVIFMLIEGLPLFFLELSIGQRMRKSAILCWRDIHPALFGIGVGCLMVSLMLCLYYVVVIAWCCYYFFISFTSDLPWKKEILCHNWDAYNGILSAIKDCESGSNPNCTTNSTMYKALKYNETTFPDCCVRDPPQYYFYHHALQISTSIEDPGIGMNVKLLGCLVFAWVITYLCVVKGIKSSGKVVYFTATFPYIILIILFFRGVTLEGAGNGIKTFFTPKWDLLLDANIWKDAATQMFFTLSLGFGALIAFASYMPIHNQVMRDAYTVVFVNCGTSLFAGIVVFSILGYRELKTGIPADKVGSGPGLAFMTFSDAMLLMDVSPLWAILFFLMLILLGIDSEFGTLEAAIGPIIDLKIFPKIRKEFLTLLVAVVLFLFGLSMVSAPGFYIFQMFDDYSVTIPLLVIALFQCIGVAWVYGNNRFADDIEFMTGKRPWVGWMICWKYISPLALFVVLVALIVQQAQSKPTYSKFVGCVQKPFGDSAGSVDWTEKVAYPGWGIFVVVMIVLVSTVPILIWLIKDWPKDWARSFHKTFCTGVNNYLPDPERDPNENRPKA